MVESSRRGVDQILQAVVEQGIDINDPEIVKMLDTLELEVGGGLVEVRCLGVIDMTEAWDGSATAFEEIISGAALSIADSLRETQARRQQGGAFNS